MYANALEMKLIVSSEGVGGPTDKHHYYKFDNTTKEICVVSVCNSSSPLAGDYPWQVSIKEKANNKRNVQIIYLALYAQKVLPWTPK